MTERRIGPSVEELRSRVGQELGVSDWLTLDQPRIDAFAETTGDTYHIHVDPARAREAGLAGTIAHGFLTLSMLPLMIENAVGWAQTAVSVNYGLDRVRFLAPVLSGRRVRGHFRLTEMTEKRAGQWQQKVEATVEIEGEDRPPSSRIGYSCTHYEVACRQDQRTRAAVRTSISSAE